MEVTTESEARRMFSKEFMDILMSMKLHYTTDSGKAYWPDDELADHHILVAYELESRRKKAGTEEGDSSPVPGNRKVAAKHPLQ